jgi:hypothetical protein
MQMKTAYARSLHNPKLTNCAGSNGRYSLRCAAIAAQSGLPCVNLSVAVGVGVDYQLQHFELAGHGQRFIMRPNRSQYPLSCFYDALSRLNEECRIEHSNRVGRTPATELHLQSRFAS